MSEAIIPAQHESAVVILRELASETDAEIQALTHKIELAQERHGGFLDAIARLTRVPRTRKPRTIREMTEGASDPEDPSPRPTVFATRSLEVADAA